MPEINRPLKVFLSYASQDKPLVRELSRRLVGEGWIETWQDEKNLLPGQDWRVKIEEAVEEADVVIIVLSQHSVSKEGHVQKELRYAREIALEKPEETIFLIPLRLDECEVPRGLRFYQWVDYFGERKNDGYASLVESLQLRYEQKLKQEEEASTHQEKIRKEYEAAEKARLEAEKKARQKAIKEKAEREAAEKVAREKAESEFVKELPQSVQDRILEAAIQKQVVVDKPASLYVWIKQFNSKSIISVVKSDIDENVVLDENNVKSKGLEIEFPIEQGKVTNASISLRLVAPEFSPPTQKKEIKVPVNGDSEVCTFLVTPKKAGRLLLNIEVLKDKVSVANRNLWTMAIGTETKESSPMLLVTIPIFVIVQSKQDVINISGNISDSVIVSGDHNAINAEKARLEVEEQEKQKAAKEKAERERAEKKAAEKAWFEKTWLEAEEREKQKAAREEKERETTSKIALEKAESEAARKTIRETAEREVAEEARDKAVKEKTEYKTSEKYPRVNARLAYGVALMLGLVYGFIFYIYVVGGGM